MSDETSNCSNYLLRGNAYAASEKMMTKKNNTQLDPDTIYETLKSKYDLFSDPSGMPFATIKDKNNETVPTLDIKFIRSVTRNIHNQTNRPPLSNLVKSYITLLEDDALNGPIKKVWLRYAYKENIIYVDTADENGNIIRITADGPTVIPKQECPEVFYKTKRTRPLPKPDFEGSVEEILPFFHLENQHNIVLLLSCMLKAMIPIGATPLVSINGPQNTGKTIKSRLTKDLIDPTSPLTTGTPNSERQLFISAINSYCLAYDNLSSLNRTLSDLYCTLVTGAGYCTRKLHTDTDEIIFDGKRFLIMNGIPNFLWSPDICQRSVFLETAPIPAEERLPENILLHKWEKAKPRILGGFYKAVSVALRNIEYVNLDSYNRMADFEQWVVAAIDALPFTQEQFHQACEANREHINDEAIDADPVASAVVAMITQCYQWTGTASQLLYQLSLFTTDAIKRTHLWPAQPNKLTENLRRMTVFLAERCIKIEFYKSGDRYIKIYSTAPPTLISQSTPAPVLPTYYE